MVRLLILLGIFSLVDASHFRGMHISWKPAEGTAIEIPYRIAWRRTSSGHSCNASMISSSTQTNGEGTLSCQSCSPKIAIVNPMSYVCSDFSATDDWTLGEKTVTFDYTSVNETTFYIGYTSCCWVILQNGGQSVDISVMALINTTAMNRNGVLRINNSPVTSLSPVTRLIRYCNYTITIPVTDADGDIIRCRWAVPGGVVNECDEINCQPLTGAILIGDECKIIFQPNTLTGYFGVTIQIEDFMFTSDSSPLSSVPVQFLLHVVSSTSDCSAIPTFIGDTISTGSRVNVFIGTTYNLQIYVNSSAGLSDITLLSPPAKLTKTSPEKVTSSGTIWYSNITWTPTQDQEGEHIICFTAQDVNGVQSEQRCVFLTVTGYNMNSYACDPISGGMYQQCAKIPPYENFQIAYCLSAEEVLARTNNTIRCADTCRSYCYLTCMTEKYGIHNFSEVSSDCLCGNSDTTDAETQLPSWCLIPQGKCDFFTECMPSRFSACDNVRNITSDLQTQCRWFEDQARNENCSSSTWMKDVRKCFQSYMMTSVFRANLSLCSDITDTLYSEAYTVCFADATYDIPFCQLPYSFRRVFIEELVRLIPLIIREDNAVKSILGSMERC